MFVWYVARSGLRGLRTVDTGPDVERVVWVEQPWGEHRTKVNVLQRKTAKLLTEEVGKIRLVFLRDDGAQLTTVTEEGAVRQQPIPAFDGSTEANLVAAEEDPRQATWQRSLVEFGLGEFAKATEMTAAFANPGVPVKYQIGALYTRSHPEERMHSLPTSRSKGSTSARPRLRARCSP